MNIQKYASLYAKFHGAVSFEMVGDVIVIPFTDIQWVKSIILKLNSFEKTIHESKRVLISAFKSHFKTDAIDTVFQLHDSSNSILLGNERVVFPNPNGNCRLCATPFFLKNPKTVLHYLEGATRTLHERVFLYKNSIIYLDDCDVPRPGKNYFDEIEESDGLLRLCFLTAEPQPVIQTLADEWRNRRDIVKDPYKTTYTTIRFSKFACPHPVDDIYLPENRILGTALVNKKLSVKHPEFIIQDILNTYRNNNTGGEEVVIRDLGIFIEHPLKIVFEGLSQHHKSNTNRFLGLAINGNQPKTVLYVKFPYDRYTIYAHAPSTSWTNILYEDNNSLPPPLERVVIDSTILGYRHQNGAFLCLSYPMLNSSPVYSNLNTECILNADLDPFADNDLNVIETYYLDSKRLLHKVKHKKLLPELWCVTTKDVPTKKYSKRGDPPQLVEDWIRFVDRDRKIDYGDLQIIKLALILAKHKICFTMKQGTWKNGNNNNNRQILFEREKDIVFELDEEAIQFINDLRLDTYRDKEILQNDESGCNIM